MSEELLRRLEERVRMLEDERDVARLVGRYGPLVDTGDPAAADLWLDDGVYDVDELLMEGADAVEAMVRSRHHQELVTRGCAHFQGPVQVVVRGDEAEAVGYSLLLVRETDGFRVRRATANHWRLVRREERWRVAKRTARVLDGGAEARRVLELVLASGAGGGVS